MPSWNVFPQVAQVKHCMCHVWFRACMTSLVKDRWLEKCEVLVITTHPYNLLGAFGTSIGKVTFKAAAAVDGTFVLDKTSLLQWDATSGRLADKALGMPVFADRLTVFAPIYIIAQLHGGFHVRHLPYLLATSGTNWRFWWGWLGLNAICVLLHHSRHRWRLILFLWRYFWWRWCCIICPRLFSFIFGSTQVLLLGVCVSCWKC